MPPERLYLQQVPAVPLADTTIYELEQRGEFPRRFNLTARCVAWDLAEVEAFPLPGGKTLRKVSPLAAWTTAEVREYALAHAIPLLPLYDQGYTSIGCEPCTSLPLDPSNERSGRWQGQKLECGIQLKPVPPG